MTVPSPTMDRNGRRDAELGDGAIEHVGLGVGETSDVEGIVLAHGDSLPAGRRSREHGCAPAALDRFRLRPLRVGINMSRSIPYRACDLRERECVRRRNSGFLSLTP